MRTYKEILTPTVDKMDDNIIRVIFYIDETEMACLYYERPKKGWTNKPIMPQVWKCSDAKISNNAIYVEGLIEPKELVGWGQELIKGAGII
jgi:hypothetical protein